MLSVSSLSGSLRVGLSVFCVHQRKKGQKEKATVTSRFVLEILRFRFVERRQLCIVN